MTLQQLLAEQFQRFYGVTRVNLAGVTAADSVAQPSGGGNCINWILGHLVNVQNGAMALVGADPVWQDPQLQRAGFEPITGPGGAIDWDAMVARFFDSEARCVEAIAALTDDSLNEAMPDPFGRPSTRAGNLNLLAFHQTYHAGQIATARRAAGLPGVVKGPGQPAGEASPAS
jgi:uncharacterized damage-inducible protein DinB